MTQLRSAIELRQAPFTDQVAIAARFHGKSNMPAQQGRKEKGSHNSYSLEKVEEDEPVRSITPYARSTFHSSCSTA